MSELKSALILGATGLVGGELLTRLLVSERYDKLHVLARQPAPFNHPKLRWCQMDDMFQLSQHNLSEKQRALFRVDEVFCCLGSTMKQAGSKSQFIRQDLELPLHLAELVKQSRPKRFLMVTAFTANYKPPIFHLKLKTHLETALKRLFINTKTELYLVRPSLIMGKRDQIRMGESLAAIVFGHPSRLLFHGRSRQAAGVYAGEIAQALIELANQMPLSIKINHEVITPEQ